MRYYIRYSTYPYEGDDEVIVDTEEEVLTFLNTHASNPDFRFDVIRGVRMKFKAVERVKAYEVDKE